MTLSGTDKHASSKLYEATLSSSNRSASICSRLS